MGERGPDEQVTPDAIMQLGLGFWGSKTLLSAVELGLFAELAASDGGQLDADALAARLGLHARSARDFLDALVALRVLDRSADGSYRNTPESELFLDRRKPAYVGGMLEMANARLYPFWGSLTEALRTGEPQNDAKRGGGLVGELYADPERLKGFVKAMTGLSQGPAQAMAARFPWRDHRTVFDIGCADGGLPVRLASEHPHLTGGGFDYTGADCMGWMRQAGFREARTEHLVGPLSMVVGVK
jgi:Dimerisation domain